MNADAVTFAAGQDLVTFLIFLVIVVISAIAQWIRSIDRRRAEQVARRERMSERLEPTTPAAGDEPMPAPPRRPPEATPPASVEDEISEFLRRAAQRRSRKQPQAPPPALAPVEEPVLAEEVPPPVGGQIARRRLESDREFQERQRRLGAEVAQADEKVEARLNQVFDHQVGQLSGRLAQGREMSDVSDAFAEAEPDRLPEAAAAGFAAMLTDAESIQQAIIINEILRRPDERW